MIPAVLRGASELDLVRRLKRDNGTCQRRTTHLDRLQQLRTSHARLILDNLQNLFHRRLQQIIIWIYCLIYRFIYCLIAVYRFFYCLIYCLIAVYGFIYCLIYCLISVYRLTANDSLKDV